MSDGCCEVNTIILASTLFCTGIMACYAGLQYSISNKARKDGLFKIRYEFYLEIGGFINDYLRELEQKDYESEHMNDRPLSREEELAAESSFNSHIEERLIFKTKCLFGSDVANYLMQHLNYQSVYKSSCKNKKNIWNLLKKDKHYHPDISSYYFSEEFNTQFEKYLKLK